MSQTMALKVRDVYQGVEKESMGYKLMAALGWKEGEGLGASKQGIKCHVKATKKFDNSGVGAKEAAARSQDWTLSMHKYTQVLGGLKEVTSSHALKAMDSDAEEEVTAAAASAKPVKSKAKKSKKANESGKKRSLQADSEHGAADAPAVKKVKLASHSGRYQKREKNKLVHGYSAIDLAAILGQAAPVVVPEVVSTRRQESSDSGSDSDTEEAGRSASHAIKASSSSKSNSTAAPLSRFARETTLVKAEEMPGDATAWWRNSFHRAGIVGAHKVRSQPAKDAVKQDLITIHGFSEQDQTELYNRTQSNKTTGRLGLGQGSAPKKIAGARWAGTKTRLESDSDAEEEEAAAEPEASEANATVDDPFCDVLPGGVSITWFNGVRPAWFLKRRTAATDAEDGALLPETIGRAGKGASGQSKLKSKARAAPKVQRPKMSKEAKEVCLKTARRVLKKAASGALKLAKVQAKVLKAMNVPACERDSWCHVVSTFLGTAGAFTIDGEKISLTAAIAA